MALRGKKGGGWGWRRLVIGAACVAGLAAAGYAGSRFLPRAEAQPAAAPKAAAAPVPAAQPAAPAPAPTDYEQRPVAFLHDNEIITREQLGEYLIARYGAEKLPLLINKIIIEEACHAKGIEVTQAEVEASLAEDLAAMPNMDQKTFEDKVLKQYKKTLYEWKEDVLRPKLLMSKLVRDRVTVTEAEIQAGFEAYHGEKIDCRMIYWPSDEKNIAFQEYAKIRDSEAEFNHKATMQADPHLAATGGRLPQPLARHTIGDDQVERAAFSLQPNEMSPLIETPYGIVVVKCIQRIPADTTVSLETQRPKLHKEVFDRKVQMEIPKVFADLQKQAKVNQLLKDAEHPEINLAETTKQLLTGGPDAPNKAVPPPPPH